MAWAAFAGRHIDQPAAHTGHTHTPTTPPPPHTHIQVLVSRHEQGMPEAKAQECVRQLVLGLLHMKRHGLAHGYVCGVLIHICGWIPGL